MRRLPHNTLGRYFVWRRDAISALDDAAVFIDADLQAEFAG